jgi:hypothetical protein
MASKLTKTHQENLNPIASPNSLGINKWSVASIHYPIYWHPIRLPFKEKLAHEGQFLAPPFQDGSAQFDWCIVFFRSRQSWLVEIPITEKAGASCGRTDKAGRMIGSRGAASLYLIGCSQ